MSCMLIPFQRVGNDTRDIDFSAEITGEVTEMSSLFDDWASAEIVMRCGYARKRKYYLFDLVHQSGLAIASYAQA